jgi:hypothetical protein
VSDDMSSERRLMNMKRKNPLLRTIISTLILVIQGLVLCSIDCVAFDWQYWEVIVCTVSYMLTYVVFG